MSELKNKEHIRKIDEILDVLNKKIPNKEIHSYIITTVNNYISNKKIKLFFSANRIEFRLNDSAFEITLSPSIERIHEVKLVKKNSDVATLETRIEFKNENIVVITNETNILSTPNKSKTLLGLKTIVTIKNYIHNIERYSYYLQMENYVNNKNFLLEETTYVNESNEAVSKYLRLDNEIESYSKYYLSKGMCNFFNNKGEVINRNYPTLIRINKEEYNKYISEIDQDSIKLSKKRLLIS